jgi:putative FmdB family regulatory protein
MPIYEFVCRSCGEQFERLRGLAELGPECPVCGSGAVTRQISLIAGLSGSTSSNGGSHACACGGACSCGR